MGIVQKQRKEIERLERKIHALKRSREGYAETLRIMHVREDSLTAIIKALVAKNGYEVCITDQELLKGGMDGHELQRFGGDDEVKGWCIRLTTRPEGCAEQIKESQKAKTVDEGMAEYVASQLAGTCGN